MDTPKIKTKKRGMTTVYKTVTKGVNDKGKRYRTVEKTTTNPMSNSSATTTKTRTRGSLKAQKSGSLTSSERMSPNVTRSLRTEFSNPKVGYKVAKGEQKSMVKDGKKQKKGLKKLAIPAAKAAGRMGDKLLWSPGMTSSPSK